MLLWDTQTEKVETERSGESVEEVKLYGLLMNDEMYKCIYL